MQIKDFVDGFKATVNKESYCEKHIVNKYVPYLTKIAECNRIIDSTMARIDTNGNISFQQNTPVRFLIFHIQMLKFYTDLEINDKGFIDDFDALNEVGAFNILVSKLPEQEYKEFSTLLSMTADDYYANHRTVTSYIDNMMDNYKDLIMSKLQEGEQNGGEV